MTTSSFFLRAAPGNNALSRCAAGFAAAVLALSGMPALAHTYELRLPAPLLVVTPEGASFRLTSATASALSFGTAEVGDLASTVHVLSLVNDGPGTGDLQAKLEGSSAADFALSSNCQAVAPTSSCSLSVTARPLAQGTRLASLSVLGQSYELSVNGAPARPVVGSSTTWSPTIKTSGMSLSSGNLRTTVSGSWSTVGATAGVKQAKRYWEIRNDSGKTNWNIFVTLLSDQSVLVQDDIAGSGFVGLSVHPYNTAKYNSLPGVMLTSAGNPSISKGSSDVLRIAYDGVNGALYVGVNGTWAYGGVPTSGAAKTGAVATGLSGYLRPAVSMYGGGTDPGRTSVVNFGASGFVYPVPAGYNQ